MYLSLSKSQREAVDKIEEGSNVFITGPAGTGKSYLLTFLKEEYMGKGLHITASTGIAAINVGGSTLHSWAGLGLGNIPLSEMLKWIFSARGSRLRRKIKQAKMLAIDEISMISAELFDLFNKYLQNIRENDKPFGGLQLILFGDFLQLPPVVREGELNFCFESNAWEKGGFKKIMLTEVFRQEDKRFIELLDNIRFGKIVDQDIALLKSRFQVKNENSIIKPTILSTHNAIVAQINSEKLKELPAMERKFYAEYSGDEKKIEFLKANSIAQDKLSLKVGAQVMMLKNTYKTSGIINGSIGIIRKFSLKKDYPIVEFSNGEILTITPETWPLEKYDEAKKTVVVEAEMKQIPLLLAWAVTIHKSQGMTLEKAECDLASAFAEGQIYVALSRVRSLDGLFIKSFNVNRIKANKKVVEFYEKF
jgi:ATP-dependent DNA helicase PIF1